VEADIGAVETDLDELTVVFRGGAMYPDSFTWAFEVEWVGTGTVSSVTVADRVYERTLGTLLTDWLIDITDVNNLALTNEIDITSSVAGVATVNACRVYGVATGTTEICGSRGTFTNCESIVISHSVTTNDVLTNGVAGSLRHEFTDAFNAAAGASTNVALYSGHLERSTNHWAAAWDFTCASPSNNAYAGGAFPNTGATKDQTLISSNIVIAAGHWTVPVGSEIYFVDRADNVYTSVLQAASPVLTTDISVGLVSPALPTNITPAAILPTDYMDYLSTVERIPLAHTDREDRLYVRDWMASASYESINKPVMDDRLALCKGTLVSGDSGCPIFLLPGNDSRPVLIGTFYMSGGAPSLVYWREYLIDTIEALGADPSGVEVFDASGMEEY